MFEITYNDRDKLNEYINSKKAEANAEYDFTFENRFIIYHIERLGTLTYIALDMTTGRGSEIARKSSSYKITEHKGVLIGKILKSIKYTGTKDTLTQWRKIRAR